MPKPDICPDFSYTTCIRRRCQEGNILSVLCCCTLLFTCSRGIGTYITLVSYIDSMEIIGLLPVIVGVM